MSAGSYAGTRLLARAALRRDRVMVPVWMGLLAAGCYGSAAATPSLYSSVADRVAAARTINASPAVVALYGPILDPHSLGEVAMAKMTVLYALFVAGLFIVLVRRHTRVEEENGQTELVGGTAVGADAPLAAAVLVCGGLAVVLGMLAAAVDALGGLPVTGSIAFGASWAGIGLVATGLAAVACQVSASARTCAGIATGVLGVLYVLRAIGDTSVSWLSWCSPYGWSTQLRAWSDPRWWVLPLYVVLAAALLVAAQLLRARRDLGSGLVAARPGPASGATRLSTALALEFRLHALALGTWSTAVAVLGVVLGAIVPNIGQLLNSSSARSLIERLGGVGAIQDALIAAEFSIFAVVVTCFGITVVTRAASDEADGRTEQVLATGTSRIQTFVAVLVVSFAGTAWLMFVMGVAVGLGYGRNFAAVLGAGLVHVPAVWVVVALALLGFSLLARRALLGWAFVTLFLSLGQLGEMLRLPGWVTGLSPYSHVPAVPVAEFSVVPELALTAIAVLAVLIAWTRYRSRDIV
jgi:ABC-2 type transport system permease protein